MRTYYDSIMNEGSPKKPSDPIESIETRNKELVALAKELYEGHEIFPSPGFEPEAYAKLKASDEELPDYTIPINDLIRRFKNEGMKVVLGEYPESGNIFILPAQSDDKDTSAMVLPKHFEVNGVLNEKLKQLIEKSK